MGDSIQSYWSNLFTQEKIIDLIRDLEEARKVFAEGETLEPVLRQRIHELEGDRKDLMVINFIILFEHFDLLNIISQLFILPC